MRGLIDSTLGVDAAQSYDPYGQPDGSYGAGFGFTGEQTDSNGQVYLRARYYNPGIGIFPSLDPFEGTMQRPMSLNGYSWVEGNTPNMVDPSGRTAALANNLNSGMCSQTNDCQCSIFPFDTLCWADCLNVPISSCVRNSPRLDWYMSNNLWTCDETGCQAWLDEAHCILSEGYRGHPSTNNTRTAATILYESTHPNPRLSILGNTIIPSAGIRISFDLERIRGVARARTWIQMPRISIAGDIHDPNHPTSDFLRSVSVLVHEVVHTTQTYGVPSIRQEIEAFNIQSAVSFDLGLDVPLWRRELIQFGGVDGIALTRDFDELCDARDILSRCASSTYANPPYMLSGEYLATFCGGAQKPVSSALTSCY